MAPILPPARRGSKRDWKTITAEIEPQQYERLERMVQLTGRRRTDLVAEAVVEYLDRLAA